MMSMNSSVALAALCLVVGGCVGFLLGASWMHDHTRAATDIPAAPTASARPSEYDTLLTRYIDVEHQLDYERKKYAAYDMDCAGIRCGELIRRCGEKAAAP